VTTTGALFPPAPEAVTVYAAPDPQVYAIGAVVPLAAAAVFDSEPPPLMSSVVALVVR